MIGIDMNYFEQQLRRVAKACDGLIGPTFVGRVCYGDLGGDNRARLEFVTQGHADHYTALRATILNRAEGSVDVLLFRFSDIWGAKKVGNPNFREGVIPHIWTSGGDSEWYVYHPTDADIKQLAAEVGAYLAVFTDRSLLPEKAWGQTSEKESVIKAIRESKPSPAVGKAAPSHRKSGQER